MSHWTQYMAHFMIYAVWL